MIVRSLLGGDLLVLSTMFGLTNAFFRPTGDSSVAPGRGCALCFVERPAELFD